LDITEKVYEMVQALEIAQTCPSCLATPALTPQCCACCCRVTCQACCPQKPLPPAPFIICASCRLQPVLDRAHQLDAREQSVRKRVLSGLHSAYQVVLGHVKRESTRSNYARGIAALRKFGLELQLVVLPASRDVVIAFAMYELIWQKLDSSTITNHLSAISDYHDYIRQLFQRAHPHESIRFGNPVHNDEVRDLQDTLSSNYKKKSSARQALTIAQGRDMFARGFGQDIRGRHHRISVWLPLLGMLRQRAATMLVVVYRLVPSADGGPPDVVFLPASDIRVAHSEDGGRHIVVNVDVDKNVNALNRRQAYIPDEVSALGLRPVSELLAYLRDARPPSGGYLLASPKSINNKTFRSGRFTGISAAFKRAFRKVYPLDPLVDLIGSHSGRKSLAQWLWNDGHCRRIIADAGGWFLKRDAVDLYFKTAPHIILNAVRFIGPTLSAVASA